MIPKTAKDWNIFSKCLMGLSALFIILGILLAIRSYLFTEKAIKSQGTIIKLVENHSDGKTLYSPVFTFIDNKGKKHKIFSSTSSYPPIGEVGDTIEILYDPNNPKHAEENCFFNIWGIALIPFGLGIFYFIIFGVVAFYTQRKITKSEQKNSGDAVPSHLI